MKSRKSMLIGKIFLALSILCLFSTVVTAKPVENNDFGSVPIPVDRKLSDREKELLDRSKTDEFKKALEANDLKTLADACEIYLRELGVKRDIEKVKYYAQKGYNKKDARCTVFLAETTRPSYKLLREAYDFAKNDCERMYVSLAIAHTYCHYILIRHRTFETDFKTVYAVPWVKNFLSLYKICGNKCKWTSDEELSSIVKDWTEAKEALLSDATIHTAESLLNEYDDNIFLFQKKYNPKSVNVTGYAGRVQRNSMTGQYYLELYSKQNLQSLGFIECVMKDNEVLAGIKKGEKIILRGICNSINGFVLGAFRLTDCQLYKDPPIAPPEIND